MLRDMSDTLAFVEVVERGSFTAAAESFRTSKARISKKVQDLEQRLGVKLGLAVDLFDAVGVDASTEPAKRYFKYARPWRWSTDVAVLPTVEPAKSDTPAKDGGYPSGHTAEAWRDGLTMAYLVPERFQEMVTRAVELGDSRIIAGMHSPLDVMSGRMLGTAAVVYNLNRPENAELKQAARDQAVNRHRNGTPWRCGRKLGLTGDSSCIRTKTA